MSEFIGKARKVKEQFTAEQERIGRDRDLSAEGKAKRLAKAFLAMQTELDDLKARHHGWLKTEKRRLASRAFSPEVPHGARPLEAVAVTTAYRDAQDRAGRLERSDDALRLLERAHRSGDEQLARAVAGEAFDRGWGGVLEKYGEEFPEHRDRFSDVLRFSGRWDSRQTQFEASVAFSSPPKPRELAAVGNDFALRELAEAERPAGEVEQRMRDVAAVNRLGGG